MQAVELADGAIFVQRFHAPVLLHEAPGSSQSAAEKYQHFVRKYPPIVQRAPQHLIASYLGFTPESLSRVRRQL